MENKVAKQSEFQSIKDFAAVIERQPAKSEIKTNKFADGAKYIPIGTIENKLDKIYYGLWQTSRQRLELIGNSLVCTIRLRVYHPVFKIWITREGTGAVPVQLNKGERVMNFETIKKDAIKKGAPAAKAQSIRNAAQSLGEQFGRNLNRDDVATIEYVDESIEGYNDRQREVIELIKSSNIDDTLKQRLHKRAEKGDSKTLEEIVNYIKKI
jgi:hypothetical protein